MRVCSCLLTRLFWSCFACFVSPNWWLCAYFLAKTSASQDGGGKERNQRWSSRGLPDLLVSCAMCLHYACIALSCIESLCTCDRGCAFCPSLFVKRSRYILCLCLHLSNCHPSSQASCRKHHFFTSDMRTQLYAGMGSTCSTTCTTRRF